MSAATTPVQTPAHAWTYQAPRRPAGHPAQCYYRTDACGDPIRVEGAATAPRPDMEVFRWSDETDIRLAVEIPGPTLLGEMRVQFRLDRASIAALRDAFNDVLQDIAQLDEERERNESFQRIQEELDEAGEDGPGCYYAHPDVHYVPADKVADKVRELNAAGARQFIVLADPVTAEASAEGGAA